MALHIATMELTADWKEWPDALNSKSIKFVMIGAHAVAFHGSEADRRLSRTDQAL
jgi:hypothetical protein